MELQAVPNDQIRKIYCPRDYLKDVLEKNHLSRIEKCSLELCELFVELGKIPIENIGITGSPMIGLQKDDSDIDLIIYGTDISLSFQEKLRVILKENNFCMEYNLQEYQTHYEWRAGGSDIPFDKFLFCERRKLHQGMYKGFEFFIRYIKSPEDWGGNFYDYQYENCGRIRLKAKIIDSQEGIFTPCSYKIETLQIIENNSNLKTINLNMIKEISSFRGRFCEQAIPGEVVMAEGKLEKVLYKNKREYHRILLQDQVSDKMIIIQS
jgi:hypothetical protein